MAAHPKKFNLHGKKVLILLDTKTKVQNKPFGSGARCTTYSEHFAVHFHAVISIHFCAQHSMQIRAQSSFDERKSLDKFSVIPLLMHAKYELTPLFRFVFASIILEV